MASYARIQSLKKGLHIQEIKRLLQKDGYDVECVPKSRGSHLSPYEIQIKHKGCKITIGMTDYNSIRRIREAENMYIDFNIYCIVKLIFT